jgi:hypothetical protein
VIARTNLAARRAAFLLIALASAACGGDAKPVTPAAPSAPAPAAAPAPAQANLPAEEHMETAKAVMVTVELDYGPNPPSIAQAIKDVERRYEPADGQGRTFAILDAYGEPTPDGKLHMSMHVSSEKPGRGTLVWRKTGEVLWRSTIEGAAVDPTARNLGIFIDDGKGNSRVIDGSRGPKSILDAVVKETGQPVRDFWPDGQEREVTFIYSACGCPVKVMAKRAGERTVRTKELPVIFPDDPPAAATIAALMKW